jgi:predicted nucleotidyltransferase
MKNTIINNAIIERVANALGELNEKVIYVGGATVSLYINDPAAEDVRPTKDVDISIKVASFVELEDIREQLTDKGFKQSSDLDVICRFKLEDILVDVMATKPIAWAPANPWFEKGFEKLEKTKVNDITIQIMPLTFFLASKFTAYHDRGGNDPRFSHDLEDIIYIIDNRTDWHQILINEQDQEVKEFLINEFSNILTSNKMQEAILGNLFYETQDKRFGMIMDKINQVVNS